MLTGSSDEAPLRIIKQNVYTMVNNITFSTDMDTLYLIDNGRAIAFPLNNKKGILIGVLKGQLTVATDFEPPVPDPDFKTAEGRSVGFGPAKEVKLETQKTVWSAAYHQSRRILSFVGATEVEVRVSEDVDYKPELVFFDLKNQVINIRRKGEAIIVKPMLIVDKDKPDRVRN